MRRLFYRIDNDMYVDLKALISFAEEMKVDPSDLNYLQTLGKFSIDAFQKV